MKAFWTLMKTEFRDHLGGALWLPLIVAGLITLALGVTAISALSGDQRLIVDGDGVRLIGIEEGDATQFEIEPDAEIRTLPDGSVEKTQTSVKKDKDVMTITKTVTITKDGQERVSTTTRTINPKDGVVLSQNKPDAQEASEAGFIVMVLSLAPVVGITLFASYFMMVSALHAERADRSILFWKSMPVSDGTVVAAKALGNTLLPVGSAIAIGCGAFILNAVILSIVLANQAEGLPLSIFWSASTIMTSVLTIVSFALCYLVWAAPLYGWMLLASALAPRSPFLVATVPLVVVVVLEQLFLKSTWFGTQLLYRFSSTPIFNIENKAAHAGNQNVTSLFSSGLEIPLKIFSSLATLECLVGLLLAGALGFAAVLIRQRKAL